MHFSSLFTISMFLPLNLQGKIIEIDSGVSNAYVKIKEEIRCADKSLNHYEGN